jgi:hypothetical protein
MDFVNVYKMMGKFEHFVEDQENHENMPSEAKEAMREIQIVMNETLGHTRKPHKFGIDDIKFDLINYEQTSRGIQVNLEAHGSAYVRDKDHLSSLLQRLVQDSRKDLQKKDIFLEMMYHKIDMSAESQQVDFNVICAAIIFT